jgi:hypothetical protein
MTLASLKTDGTLVPQQTQNVPNGSAAAAILALGVGSCVLGILAVAGDLSKTLARWLTFYVPTGPLSGVSSLAIFAWLATWIVLARLWQRKTLSIGRINIVSFALLAIGLLLTFPPFADLLLGK